MVIECDFRGFQWAQMENWRWRLSADGPCDSIPPLCQVLVLEAFTNWEVGGPGAEVGEGVERQAAGPKRIKKWSRDAHDHISPRQSC